MSVFITDPYAIVQTAGETYIGNDTDQVYSVNPNLIQAGDMVTIIDQGGSNAIELPAGLEITESIVTNDELVLTLSNGAIINLRGADAFTFNVGQNQAGGDNVGTEKGFYDFAQDILGVTLPAEGEGFVEGGPATVNDDGTADVDPDPERIPVTEDLTAVDGVAETFVYRIDSSNGQVFSLAGGDWTITNFNVGEDSLVFEDVAGGTVTTETFVDAITVSDSEIFNETSIFFDEDPEENSFFLTLTGVVDGALSTVDFIVNDDGTSDVGDTIPPSLSGTTPTDNAVDVAVESDIVLTFDEEVQAGTGNIAVFNVGGLVEAVPVGNAVFDGNTVTVDLPADLEPGTAYFVRVDATAIEDLAGNAFAGITNQTDFNFSTVEGDPEPPVDVAIDTAAFPTQTDFDAAGDGYNYIDDAAVSNYAVIDNFSTDDTISFVNADVNDYAFSNEGEDVTLSYNYNDDGTMNVIELTGVVSSDAFVYDLASFTDTVGFYAFG
jgi:hypothetical protein